MIHDAGRKHGELHDLFVRSIERSHRSDCAIGYTAGRQAGRRRLVGWINAQAASDYEAYKSAVQYIPRYKTTLKTACGTFGNPENNSVRTTLLRTEVARFVS